jgi:hypothetical protein
MSELDSATFDPNQRRLCPDGACVGIIGSDGRCKICGMHGAMTGDDRGFASDNLEEEDAMAALGDADDTFDPSRSLCPDGACVGVLGPDRRCKVCGRSAEA